MRVLLTEFYSLSFKATRSKLFSYFFGILYISVLNYIIVLGLSQLLHEWLGFFSIILRLFSYPVYFFTAALSIGLTYWFTPTVQSVAKDAKKKTKHTTLLVYTLLGMVLFVYVKYGDAIFS